MFLTYQINTVFSAEFCLPIQLTLKVPLLEPIPHVPNKRDDF